MIKLYKTFLSLLALTMLLSLAACGSKSKSTFPNIDDDSIPDVLKMTVGSESNVYLSSGITDNPDYKSVLIITFKGTTKADYTSLMEHYSATSTGKDEDGFLQYDWGRLHVKTDGSLITINALIK